MAEDVIERNRQVGRKFVNFLAHPETAGDPSQLFGPNFVYHNTQGVPFDLAGTMQLVEPIVNAVSDRTLTVEDEIVTSDRVVYRWSRSGVFAKDAWGLHATGKKFSDVGVTVLAIDNQGKISEIWESFDLVNFLGRMADLSEFQNWVGAVLSGGQ